VDILAEDSDISLRRITRGDFETVVEVIGNPIRRRIIQKLSEGPDYTLRLSNELNINQQLASKHMKIIRDAELVDVIRQKSDKGPEKKMFSLNKFYSLQIDFSPRLYNERLISFNNPYLWVDADNFMDRLENQVNEISEEECGIDKINPLGQIVQAIDNELESLEKRRARLLYIRNLAMNSSAEALEEVDRRKRQVMQHILNQGQVSIESISRHLQLREEIIRDIVNDLERDDLVATMGDMVYLVDLP
jgi:predicted transcriptional regulator